MKFISETFRNLIIHLKCRKYGIENYTINEDGSIDVNGLVNFYDKGLTKLPLKFRRVSGWFSCSNNRLTSLEGCPEWVGDNFYCYNNRLTSLRGGPKKVIGNFLCHYNRLSSLKGCPEELGGHIYCVSNELKDVEGFPEFWEGNLTIFDNPVSNILDLFPWDKWYKVVYLINEYGAIKGNIVNLYVLEEIFLELGLEPPQIDKIKGYEIY